MTTMQQAFDASVLAPAAYTTFDLSVGSELSGSLLNEALASNARLTDADRNFIAAQYDLVAFRSGAGDLQAAVFRDKRVPTGQPGGYVLAIRGTPAGPISLGLFSAGLLLRRKRGQAAGA